MKQTLLIATILLSILSNPLSAQQYANIGIEMPNLKDGDTLYLGSDGMNPLNLDYQIVNYGLDTLKATDTLFVTLKIGGNIILDNSLTGPVLPDSTKNNGSFNFPDFQSWPPALSTSSFCLEVTTSANINDTVAANNTTCANVFISFPLSVNTQSSIPKINVFPNPNNGSFTINGLSHIQDITKVEVVNILGEVIFSKQIDSNTASAQEITLGDVSSGIYILNLTTKGTVHTERIQVIK